MTIIRVLISALILTLNQLVADSIIGKWICEKDADNAKKYNIPKIWIIEYDKNGEFKEAIDNGFGILVELRGNYSIEGENLTLCRNNYKRPWVFTYKINGNNLILTNTWNKDVQQENAFIKIGLKDGKSDDFPRLPKTKVEAIEVLKKILSKDDIEKLKKAERKDLFMYHHGLGTFIRNAFNLWKGNRDLIKDCSGDGVSPDSVSQNIIVALWEDLNKS